jgi:Mg2+ and Co2+ transporter CorA
VQLLKHLAQLFNLISQRDNDLNIGIARASKELAAASKRDSSAMKIIALMTTLFLPGTFIAVGNLGAIWSPLVDR